MNESFELKACFGCRVVFNEDYNFCTRCGQPVSVAIVSEAQVAATTAHYDPSLDQDDGKGIWATQHDDPAQHISMEGNIAVRPEEFQAMLDTAPVVDLRKSPAMAQPLSPEQVTVLKKRVTEHLLSRANSSTDDDIPQER